MPAKKFDLKYKSFEDWCATHAGSLPRVNAETAEERSLANWLKNKLTSCRQGKLPDDQLAKLKKIPGLSDFPHVSQESRKHAAQFHGACKNLELWCKTHGGVLSPSNKTGISPEEMSMAVWLKNKLAFNKRGKLPNDQIAKLRKIPLFRTQARLGASREGSIPSIQSSKDAELVDLDNLNLSTAEKLPKRSRQKELRYKSFEEWCATHGGLLPRRGGETAEERSLATWLTKRLQSYRRGKLSAEELKKLRTMPSLSNFPKVSGRSQRLAEKFDRTCKGFQTWCAAHEGSWPKRSGATQEERSLAIWFSNKLQNYRHGKLPHAESVELKKFPHFSEKSQSSRSQKFHVACNQFEEWCASHNGTAPKHSGDSKEERFLVQWFQNKLHRYRCGKLPHMQIAELKKLPHFLDRSSSRSKKFDLTCASFQVCFAWCASHDGALPKQTGETEEERSLAIWLRNKLSKQRRGKLPEEQLVELKKFPCLSNFPNVSRISQMLTQKFDLTYENLKDWCAAHKGILPKRSGATAQERSLAMWLDKQIQKHRQGKLPYDQFEKMRNIPCLQNFPDVSRRSETTAQRFDCTCKAFKTWCDTHRGMPPKQTGETEEERSLAIWLRNKLSKQRRGKLPEEQLVELKKFPCLSNFPNVSRISQMLTQKFDLTYENLKDWCAAHKGILPKRSGATAQERSLAMWLDKQIQKHRQGKLPYDQFEKMRNIPCLQNFPDVSRRSETTAQRFDCTCKAFKTWCDTHGGSSPKKTGETEERSLATWFKNILYKYRRGKLSIERMAALEKLPHFLDRLGRR